MSTPEDSASVSHRVAGSVFDLWWVRILLTLGVLCVSAVAVLPFATDQYTVTFVVYSAVGVSIIGIELLRPGSSVLSSGLGFSRFTIRQLIGGGGSAVLILGLVVAFSLAMGAAFVSSSRGVLVGEITFLAVASAGEEFIFRGTIFEAVRERFGKWWAIGITSVIFGVAHVANPGITTMAVVNVILAGVVLGVMVAQTQSLWMSISFHIVWNCLVRIFIGTLSGDFTEPMISTLDTSAVPSSLHWLITGSFGIEEGAITTLLLTAGIIVILSQVRPDRFVRAAKMRVIKNNVRGILP